MNQSYQIRAVKVEDLTALKQVISANELFPAEMLDEMISGYLQSENQQDLWLTCEVDLPIAIAYCAPEKMTEGTWNLYLIAVHPDHQGQGCGAAIIKYLEKILKARKARLLLVETSSLPQYKAAQQFYFKCGFEQEARIRDFYQAGEDKIVFRKTL